LLVGGCSGLSSLGLLLLLLLRLVELGLLEHALSVLVEYLQDLVAVGMNELGERLEQRKHHVVDEAQLHARRSTNSS